MTRRQLWVAFNTIVTKEIVRFLRIWTQTILPPAITMGIYFVVFGRFLGDRIKDFGDFSYIQFIVPGLVMMAVITNSFSNVSSSFYSAKFQRNIEELLVAPVPNYLIIWGFVAGGVARGLCVGAIVTAVSLFFVPLQVHDPLSVFFMLVLTATLFSLGGLLNAIFAKSFDDISIIPTFVLTPLTYLGGVFYSIELLPPFWQAASHVNPIIYMINGFRYGFIGISDVPMWMSYLVVSLFIVVLYAVCWHLVKKGTGLRH